jgi:hypothetical protein
MVLILSGGVYSGLNIVSASSIVFNIEPYKHFKGLCSLSWWKFQKRQELILVLDGTVEGVRNRSSVEMLQEPHWRMGREDSVDSTFFFFLDARMIIIFKVRTILDYNIGLIQRKKR